MRFARIEAYKIFDADEFARPITMELQSHLKWPCSVDSDIHDPMKRWESGKRTWTLVEAPGRAFHFSVPEPEYQQKKLWGKPQWLLERVGLASEEI